MSDSKSEYNTHQMRATMATINNLVVKSQPYTAEITRANPTAFVFLIDRSWSMENGLAEKVASTLNDLFNELIMTCKRADGIGDYAELLVIGYGGEREAKLAWQGNLNGRNWIKVSELYNNHTSVKNVQKETKTRGGTKIETYSQYQWILPESDGTTPMLAAFKLATRYLAEWIERNQNNYPPIVFNITDGEPTDGDYTQLLSAAKVIKGLHTTDGNVILFNIHITQKTSDSIFLPSHKSQLGGNRLAEDLFDFSSVLPKTFYSRITDLISMRTQDNYVAMSYNADLSTLWRLLQIGTRTTNR